jgi:hypothetical protein
MVRQINTSSDMELRMKIFWEVVGIAWFALSAVLHSYLGVAGAILALLIWPLCWIGMVNLREHWPQRKDHENE